MKSRILVAVGLSSAFNSDKPVNVPSSKTDVRGLTVVGLRQLGQLRGDVPIRVRDAFFVSSANGRVEPAEEGRDGRLGSIRDLAVCSGNETIDPKKVHNQLLLADREVDAIDGGKLAIEAVSTARYFRRWDTYSFAHFHKRLDVARVLLEDAVDCLLNRSCRVDRRDVIFPDHRARVAFVEQLTTIVLTTLVRIRDHPF